MSGNVRNLYNGQFGKGAVLWHNWYQEWLPKIIRN